MSHTLQLEPGQIFAQQFRVVRPLAQGGMGAVYVVEQLSTGKLRALKLMLASAALLDGTRRFEQEARTSSLIQSEHVVDVIAAGVEGPERIPWLAMELLEGEPLESYLARSGALSATEAYELLAQLAHALSAAHDIAVVHRDIKPDNVFLAKGRSASSELMVKVLDFGLATVVQADSRNTTAMGSPLWMAPEQAQQDEPISLATDVWALGLLAFRMLTGRGYWLSDDGSLAPLIRELLLSPLPRASLRAQELGAVGVPPGFDAWFERCVVRAPELRFQHARQAWEALARVLEDAGAEPHRPSLTSVPPQASPALTPRHAGPSHLAAATQQSSTADVRAFLGTPSRPPSAPPVRKRKAKTRWLLSLPVLALIIGVVWSVQRGRRINALPARSTALAAEPVVAPPPPSTEIPQPTPVVSLPEPLVASPPALKLGARPTPKSPAPVPAPKPSSRPRLPDLL